MRVHVLAEYAALTSEASWSCSLPNGSRMLRRFEACFVDIEQVSRRSPTEPRVRRVYGGIRVVTYKDASKIWPESMSSVNSFFAYQHQRGGNPSF